MRCQKHHTAGYADKKNPRHVTDNVNEAIEVLHRTLNTHKCLLESGVKIQKKMESHPAIRKLGIFQRPRSASLGNGGSLPLYAQ